MGMGTVNAGIGKNGNNDTGAIMGMGTLKVIPAHLTYTQLTLFCCAESSSSSSRAFCSTNTHVPSVLRRHSFVFSKMLVTLFITGLCGSSADSSRRNAFGRIKMNYLRRVFFWV